MGTLKRFAKYGAVFIVIAAILYLFAIYFRMTTSTPNYLFWKIDLLTTESFSKIFLIDTQNIWLIGKNGSLYMSEDSGESWVRMKQPDGTPLNDIYFLDKNHGWVTGENGVLISTRNGGKTWNTSIVEKSGHTFNAVWFHDERTGVLGGMDILSDTGLVFRTTDGGQHWIRQDFPDGVVSDIVFFDANLGIAVTEDEIVKSDNGGETWIKETLLSSLRFRRIIFIDRYRWWAAGRSEGLYRTSDGGKTWSIAHDTVTLKCNDIQFFDEHRGWAVGDNGIFLFTINGGESWKRMETGSADHFNAVYFFNPGLGFICGNNGIVIKIETL